MSKQNKTKQKTKKETSCQRTNLLPNIRRTTHVFSHDSDVVLGTKISGEIAFKTIWIPTTPQTVTRLKSADETGCQVK